jgi:hypothetical protein
LTTDRGVLGPVVGRRRGYRRSGFYTLKATLRQLGPRVIDRRTTLGKQLAAWRADLIRDLGGNPSTAQQQLVELAVRTKLLLDSLDAWLLAQRSLVNSKTKSVLPVVKERTALANHLQGVLRDLGLERRAMPAPDLQSYLAAKTDSGT